MPALVPLALTWEFPDTPIIIAVTLLVSLLLIVAVNVGVKRMVRLAQHREERRNARLGARAVSVLARAGGIDTTRHLQRTAAMASLVRSASILVITTVCLLTIMSTIGVPLTPVLASAGVGGVALGFGAQSLVKDYLSGIFMIVEDQFGVGDIVEIGAIVGTVEEVTLRVTRLRDMTGKVWYVRNGEIVTVGNLSQGFSTGTVDIPIAYDEDPTRAVAVLRTVAAVVDADPAWAEDLLEEPQVLGVEAVSGGAMVLRIVVKCPANRQHNVQREIRERAKVALAEAGIRGPQVTPDLGRQGEERR